MVNKTIFLKDKTPLLKTGARIDFIPMNNHTEVPALKIHHRNNPEKSTGLYTSTVSVCVVLAVIDRDANSQIDKMVMVHFNGGLFDGQFNEFISRIESQFSSRRELVFYPGSSYSDPSFTTANDRFKQMMKTAKDKFSAIHYEPAASSCCITFDGEVGTFDYDASRHPLSHVANPPPHIIAPIDNIEKKFNELIKICKSPSLSTLMVSLQNKILSENLFIRYSLLELHYNFLKKSAMYSPQTSRQEIYEYYVRDLNEIPLLSPETKKLCMYLCATIVGIIPAVGILAYNFFHAKENRKELVQLVTSIHQSYNEDAASKQPSPE